MGGIIPPISMTENNYIMRIFEVAQPNKDSDPYDRGKADAWYDRPRAPHKYVPIEGSDG